MEPPVLGPVEEKVDVVYVSAVSTLATLNGSLASRTNCRDVNVASHGLESSQVDQDGCEG